MRRTLPLLRSKPGLSTPKAKLKAPTVKVTPSRTSKPSSSSPAAATTLLKEEKPLETKPQLGSQFDFLYSLKSAQLQSLAQRTGITSGGVKAAVLKHIEDGLAEHLSQSQSRAHDGEILRKGTGRGASKGSDELRILSIDMGIRNLAFAVLRAPKGVSSPLAGGLGSRMKKDGGKGRGTQEEKIELTTWRRISLPLDRGFSVEEFGRYLDSSPPSASNSSPESKPRVEDKSPTPAKAGSMSTEKEKDKEKESFTLQTYATHAHSIISTLLSRYKPTHVLIERQRFRSGGASAVQEWTLRVGVFEGMLWAVLHSLAQSQQGLSLDAKSVEKDVKGAEGSAGRSRPKVIAIEPARVGRFWASALASPSASEAKSEKKEKAKKSSRENKKLKIDLVGSWLQDKRFMIGDDGQEWADGYMMKWDKSTAPRPKSETKTQSETKAESELIEVGKLDDLADCLVQGVTWLEWEGVKGRIVRDGAAAFENIL